MHKRVCLELSLSCKSGDAVQKMEDFLRRAITHAEVKRTELANEMIRRKELLFLWRFSEIASKSPYAALKETLFVVNDKDKREQTFL